jgi:hypothetical protein
MEEILIACGDVDMLRKIVSDLPQGKFKPIATKKGAGIVDKVAGRSVSLAVVHEELSDGTAAQLCSALQELDGGPAILWLSAASAPSEGPFDRALRYPVPGPVLRNALRQLADSGETGYDLEKWRAFFRELKARLAKVDDQDYFQMLGVARGAPHHRLVKAYDLLSQRYHPDRYRQFRSEKWGEAIHEKATALYKEMTEAYQVLADRKLRARYDKALEAGKLRLDPADKSGADSGPSSLVDLGQTPSSKKFLKLAQSDLAGQDLASALQNLKFAQSMEPDNSAITKKIADIEQQING